MKNILRTKKITAGLAVIMLLAFAQCAVISPFSQHAYMQTTSLKVDALNVMGMAEEPYSDHEAEVITLRTNLQKQYEYERNRPKNAISTAMWEKLLDEKALLGGFLNRWKEERTLGKYYIEEEKKLVAEAFDKIAGLESKKIKSSEQ
ncbi:MAG: hypothetical protein LBF39_01045 [Prevotellaceae bacterium]|jgi:hypothetical protein|nr:hypothetical protein [Prevotellaceae bacterium]